MNPTACLKCGTSNFDVCYCEFCYKRLEQKIKEQNRTIEEHESYIQRQEARILTLKTGNENTRAFLEAQLDDLGKKLKYYQEHAEL
jgi:CRISPR/Cas system-associated endonuclease Cas3-HD